MFHSDVFLDPLLVRTNPRSLAAHSIPTD